MISGAILRLVMFHRLATIQRISDVSFSRAEHVKNLIENLHKHYTLTLHYNKTIQLRMSHVRVLTRTWTITDKEDCFIDGFTKLSLIILSFVSLD